MSEATTTVYYKAMSVFGCEVGDISKRAKCHHNCCAGENCVTWMEKLFRDYERLQNAERVRERGAELAQPLPVKREHTAVGDYRCPICNAAFIEGAGITPYCGNCGQRLEWPPDAV